MWQLDRLYRSSTLRFRGAGRRVAPSAGRLRLPAIAGRGESQGARVRVASHPRFRPPVVPVIIELVAPAGQGGRSPCPVGGLNLGLIRHRSLPYIGGQARAFHAGQEPERFRANVLPWP